MPRSAAPGVLKRPRFLGSKTTAPGFARIGNRHEHPISAALYMCTLHRMRQGLDCHQLVNTGELVGLILGTGGRSKLCTARSAIQVKAATQCLFATESICSGSARCGRGALAVRGPQRGATGMLLHRGCSEHQQLKFNLDLEAQAAQARVPMRSGLQG
jgi:hypothetical protein